MNLNTKKIIAREFLFLLLCVAIGLATFLLIYPYNFFKQANINKLSQEINIEKNIVDSLSKLNKEKEEKQFWFTDKYVSKFNIPREDYINATLWNGLAKLVREDSIKIKWEKTWNKELVTFNEEVGFKTPESFQAFILTNLANPKDAEILKIKNERIKFLQSQKNDTVNKVISNENQLRSSALVIIISIIFLFLLRYTFYGFKWSMKILRQS